LERDYYRDQLEADFQHYYGLDLRDVFTGKISLRRAAVLTNGLPPGAGVRRLFGGDGAWSDETRMLAGLVDQVVSLAHNLAGGKGARPKPTVPPEEHHVEREKSKVDKLAGKARRFMDRFGR
jgi:hypothetical protein